MGLSVTRVTVADFRSYESFVLEPDPSLTVLAGPNAAGKTNLVEAVQLLTETDSFRKPSWGDTIRMGADSASLKLEAEGDGRKLEIDLSIARGGRRHYSVNGKPRRAIAQVAGVMPCVVFTPDDLRMVKDSADRRRAALDGLGAQLSPTYSRLRVEYDRVLRQRNALLREGATSSEILGPWTERLASVGGSLVTHRRRLFDRVSKSIEAIYSKLAREGRLEVQYLPSWERDGFGAEQADPARSDQGSLGREECRGGCSQINHLGPPQGRACLSYRRA